MARTRTLAQLRAEVRQRADIENDPHITDAEVNRFVNQSGAALHALLVDMDEGHNLKTSTVYTSAGGSSTSLAAITDFYKLAFVAASIGGITVPLSRWTFEQMALYQNSSTWGLAQFPITYRLSYDASSRAYSLTWGPTPDGIYVITVFYYPAFTDMSADSDVYDGQDGWEEWVVLDSAIKCLVKEEGDPAAIMAEREEVMNRIRAQMQTKDLDRPGTVRDVTGWNPYMRKQVFT